MLRLRKDQDVVAFDGKGKEYLGGLKSLNATQGIIEITEIRSVEQSKVEITIAAAIPKNSKFEAIIDKATQLGVYNLIPLISERTIVKPCR